MIRIRIEEETSYENMTGLCWYECGRPVGRVTIEQWNDTLSPCDEVWEPVEANDA